MPNHFSDSLVSVPSARIARTVIADLRRELRIALVDGDRHRLEEQEALDDAQRRALGDVVLGESERGDDRVDLTVDERLDDLLAIREEADLADRRSGR